MNDFNLFRTSDLPLIAYLFYLNVPLERIETDRLNPRRKIFIFKEDMMVKSAVWKFKNKKALVEPEAYFFALRSVKARIYY
ncbi:MAG: hypothetical protein KatS3mg096_801 [Candidatus Parcubacteria bacterium]|nr:MAG: hypothetical protein KatS3mg096_801 [Candidatus Parcubacteria bacterium]